MERITRTCAHPGCFEPGTHGLIHGRLVEWWCAEHWAAALLQLVAHFRPARVALRAAA